MNVIDHMRKSIAKDSKKILDKYIEENRLPIGGTQSKKPKETCHLGRDKDNPESDSTLGKLQADEHSYIHEHLETLRMLTILQKPNCIVEIGTGRGDSTLAFAEGCAMNGKGHILTMDLKEPLKNTAVDLIMDEDLSSYVLFLQANSLKVNLYGGIDILFIDGLHTKKQVSKELDRYSREVTDDGLIILHDSYNPAHPGVQEAIQDFLNDRVFEYDMFEYYNCNGLTILRKHIPDD